MPRSTRDRPAKAPLSRDAVIDAGLRILRAEGIDAVTMRRVASELDTGAASLYVYVENREDLLNQMFDAVVGELDLDRFPNIRSMMPLLMSGDGDERFAFGLQLMINGLLNTEPPDI